MEIRGGCDVINGPLTTQKLLNVDKTLQNHVHDFVRKIQIVMNVILYLHARTEQTIRPDE
jgi:hypothetical protein